MNIEVEPQVESAIRATLPPDGTIKPALLDGRIELMIKQLGVTMPKSEYSKVNLETLGYIIAGTMLKQERFKQVPQAYHPEDIEIIQDYVNEAREGVNKVIDELVIPKNAKRYIRGALDHVELDLDYNRGKGSKALKDEAGQIHIQINIPNTFRQAYSASQNFGGEHLSPSFFKGLVYYETAHEFGHAIHCALSSPQSDAPHAWHDKRLFFGYPMTMTAEDTFRQIIADGFFGAISCERFAQFFGWEVLRGYGLSDNIRRDYIRTNAKYIFGNGFTFSQMDHFVYGYQKRLYNPKEADVLSPEEWEFRFSLEKHLTDALIIYSVSPYYTYPRETVETLINKGWRGKRRELALQRHYEQES